MKSTPCAFYERRPKQSSILGVLRGSQVACEPIGGDRCPLQKQLRTDFEVVTELTDMVFAELALATEDFSA